MRYACLMLISLAVMLPMAAAAEEPLVRFEGGIGATPAAIAAGALVINVTRGVTPGGRPWVIESLRAEVKIDGRVSVEGRGLLLGGSDAIGTPAGQSVRARLFCGPAATATVHQSGLVPIEPNGDFRIDDVLAPVPPTTAATPAAPCTSPVLLIVSGGGSWFAAGVVK
jgi:hypothetical protein